MVFGTKHVPISILSNFLFLKYLPGLRKRWPYRELNASEWEDIFKILERNRAKLTVGITATWVEEDGSLVPFFEKFPKESEILKRGLESGIIEVANHGLTHCVIGKQRPRFFSSNRKFHREFWSWIPVELHREHLKRSQQLLSQYFGCQIVTFVPPGNVWREDTEKIAFEYGIRFLSSTHQKCQTGIRNNGLIYIGGANVIAFHDRDVVLNGIQWLENLIRSNSDKELLTVRELGANCG
jgi:peptidoglycan/xylan/chitin deacetylase (PgdA/CDA1 family)